MRWVGQTRLAVLAATLVGLLPATEAAAQSINLDLGTGGTVSGQIIRLVLLVSILSLAPSIIIMVTSFTRIVVVLSFLRTAIGLQQTPPNWCPLASMVVRRDLDFPYLCLA